MPKAADLVALLLLPSLEALREIDPAAAAERHRRMARTPGDFVRGSLILHVAWLAAHPLPEVPWVWSIGDAHAGNFATLATGPLNRAGLSPVTYGIADVDDEHPAPWHWDLVRLLVSAGIALGDAGVGHRRFTGLVRCCLADYVRVLTAATNDDEHGERVDFHGLPEALKAAINIDAESGRLDAHHRRHRHRRRLRPAADCAVDAPAKRLLMPAITQALSVAPPTTREWRLLDLARRTASGGLASLGRRRWWVLAEERDHAGAWVPRVLELKERRPSVLSAILPAQPFAPLTTTPWTLPMGGDRWQRAISIGVGDALLRSRCQARTVLEPATLDDGDLVRLARLWGQLLAVAHLTSARGLGMPAKRQAAAIVVHATKHGSEVAELAWDLVRWTRGAYREFRKL